MRFALISGLLCLALTVAFPPPAGLSKEAWIAAGLALLMAIWWLTEALPLAATALVPLAVAPLLGVLPLADVAAPYSHPLVILFLGGFILARAIEHWNLHRRLAFFLLRFAGERPSRILAAIMLTTAFLSLWISNTASAMVVAPIAAAIAGSGHDDSRFATAMMLGVAFAATIGGMGSLIGTPPNAIFAAYANDVHGVEIGFIQWAMIGVPVALVLLVLAWLVLTRVTPGTGSGRVTAVDAGARGPMQAGEKRVAIIAGMTALAWITRPLIEWTIPAITLTDAGIAMLAAVSLFVIPSGQGRRLLDWQDAAKLRWDVLVLFGGGLALATILDHTGLAAWIGQRVEGLQGLPVSLFVLLTAAMIVYVGELASNTAMAAIFLPIAGASAMALGADPITFALPIALAASVGFMLPVATPPNAIVFSYPSVSRMDMLRAGAPLDAIGIVVVVALSSLLTEYLLGNTLP